MNDTLTGILDYCWKALLATGQELLLVLGPALLLALAMQLVSSFTRRKASIVFGEKVFLYGTAPGVVIHELSHAVMCLLFGHRIDRIALFAPSGDSLGCVEHSYNKRNPYHLIGNFFIGTAPIWGGALVISFAAYLLLGSGGLVSLPGPANGAATAVSLEGTVDFLEAFFNGIVSFLMQAPYGTWISDWRFYAFLYLAFTVGCHVTLSPPDISGGFWGFLALAFVLLIANLATLWATSALLDGARHLASLSASFVSILLGVFALNVILALIVAFLASLRRSVTG